MRIPMLSKIKLIFLPIEDDAPVIPKGYHVLNQAISKTIQEIEALMQP